MIGCLDVTKNAATSLAPEIKSSVISSKYYFTQEHEDAVVQYAKTQDYNLRTKLYIDLIGPAFNEMVDKIIYTYKFTYLPNIDSLKDDCRIWLMTILNGYDPKKGYKAFAYFSVIVKNWFIHKAKKHNTMLKQEVCPEEIVRRMDWLNMSEQHQYFPKREEREFWCGFKEALTSWKDEEMRPNDKNVYNAIVVLFDKSEDIEIFNRKAVYLYIREITGLNTKQIVGSLNRFRTKYRQWRSEWNSEGDNL